MSAWCVHKFSDFLSGECVKTRIKLAAARRKEKLTYAAKLGTRSVARNRRILPILIYFSINARIVFMSAVLAENV